MFDGWDSGNFGRLKCRDLKCYVGLVLWNDLYGLCKTDFGRLCFYFLLYIIQVLCNYVEDCTSTDKSLYPYIIHHDRSYKIPSGSDITAQSS